MGWMVCHPSSSAFKRPRQTTTRKCDPAARRDGCVIVATRSMFNRTDPAKQGTGHRYPGRSLWPFLRFPRNCSVYGSYCNIIRRHDRIIVADDRPSFRCPLTATARPSSPSWGPGPVSSCHLALTSYIPTPGRVLVALCRRPIERQSTAVL